jgi:4-amino-4-deoxy-L-arabinose transferase-like glycosyltransferase
VDQARSVLANRWGAALLLLGWSGCLFFYGLNHGELYRTESLRAILAVDVLRSGNWNVPKLYGEPILTKPPGMYVAIALASRLWGSVSPATARLPSAVAATCTVLLIGWYFGRQLGRRAGLVAALVLPANVLWLDRVPSAEIDMLQVAWVASAILFFLRGLEVIEFSDGQSPSRSHYLWWQAALLCVAGGVLTKWTAPAFFYAAIIPFLWVRGRLRHLWGSAHLVSATVAAALCLAWVGATVHQTGWETWYGTVKQEALQRLSPLHHPRPYPWIELVEHPVALLLGSLPWSLVALLALRPGFARLWDEPGRRLLQAMHCWVWPNLLIWSVIPGHRPRHSLPLVTGLVGLAALVWVAWITGRMRWPYPRLPAHRVLLGLLAVWLGVKLAFVHVAIPLRETGRQPESKGRQLAALVPEDETLYLFKLKDEGIMFYYGRPVHRLARFGDLPHKQTAQYCMLMEPEWDQWPSARPAEVLLRVRDEQGAPILLIRTK